MTIERKKKLKIKKGPSLSAGVGLLCSCGNKSVGTSHKGEPFCLDCVKGATPKEIMARMPVIKDKKFIEWLKGLGRE